MGKRNRILKGRKKHHKNCVSVRKRCTISDRFGSGTSLWVWKERERAPGIPRQLHIPRKSNRKRASATKYSWTRARETERHSKGCLAIVDVAQFTIHDHYPAACSLLTVNITARIADHFCYLLKKRLYHLTVNIN